MLIVAMNLKRSSTFPKKPNLAFGFLT